MDYVSYCKTALNITNIDDCASNIAQGNQKVWIVYGAILLIFMLIQLLITGVFSKKKGVGFWGGVLFYNIILLLVTVLFVTFIPQLMVLMNLI